MALSSLGGKKTTKKTPPSSAAAIAGQSWGWKSCFTPSSPLSHLFSHIWMWFLVIFQALWTDSQTQRLRNYVLVPEHDTRAQDVAADKVCTDKHTDSSEKKKKKPPCCTFCARLSGFCETLPSVTVLPCLLLTIITPYTLTRQSRGSNLKRRVGIGIRGNSRIDVGSTNMLSNYSKVPHRKECEAGPETEERQAGEPNAHTDRLRRRKSKCSENKPQKLLQPLGNLLKAHKTKVCYNTWSYNGDPFHRFFFFLRGIFFFFSFQQDVAS